MTAEAQQNISYPPLRWYRLALLAMAITLIASVVLQTEYASVIAWLALPLYWLWLASEAASSSRDASAPSRWRAQWLLAAAIVSYFGINALALKAAAILIPITAMALLYDYGYRRAAIIQAMIAPLVAIVMIAVTLWAQPYYVDYLWHNPSINSDIIATIWIGAADSHDGLALSTPSLNALDHDDRFRLLRLVRQYGAAAGLAMAALMLLLWIGLVSLSSAMNRRTRQSLATGELSTPPSQWLSTNLTLAMTIAGLTTTLMSILGNMAIIHPLLSLPLLPLTHQWQFAPLGLLLIGLLLQRGSIGNSYKLNPMVE